MHCVTRAELLFALTALTDAGHLAGDRLEHASVIPNDALRLLYAAGVHIVTQPNFIAERGDTYLNDHPADEQPMLYRVASLMRNRIPVGGGSDAPYGQPDPWAAMHAAVHRRSATGRLLGHTEAVTSEQALALFTTAANAPGGAPRRIAVGECADLCLLDRPWRDARSRLCAQDVRATIVAGRVCWQSGQ